MLAAYIKPLQFVESGAFVVSAGYANCTSLLTSCIVQHHNHDLTYVL
jgi:hypothetical protein